LFFLLFGVFIVFGVLIALFLQTDPTYIFGPFIISLVCGTPIGLFLFVWLRFIRRLKWYIAFILPSLISLLLISLFLIWGAFDQIPTNIFKTVVANPIPAGVSNIQARDVGDGLLTEEEIVAFTATPEVVDKIIANKGLAQAQDSMTEMDPGFWKFTNIDLHQDWTIYEKSNINVGYTSLIITMWVNPGRNTVLFQYLVFGP
jgi:hypothetical protein